MLSDRFNLTNIDLSLKVLFSGYLIVVAVGLLMGFTQILLTHGMADGKLGLSMDDIVYSYYGNREGTVIENKLKGSMSDKASEEEKAAIIRWVRKGAPEKQYLQEIKPIIDKNCIMCHNAASPMPDFTKLEELQKRAEADMGASVASLTRVSHIHLFGIAFIFMFVGLIFSMSTGVPTWLKASSIAMPYAFLIIDIMSWWLTKIDPHFAFLTIMGGLGYSLAFLIMWTVSMYQMWLMKSRADVMP